MSGMYMVSAQKPTAVNHSVLGHVTSSNDLNLLISKNTLLEIYKIAPEGLKFLKQIAIWGIIECLKLIEPKNEKKESILIITNKHDIMILSCETNEDGTYEIITRGYGNIRQSVGRVSQTSFLCTVDKRSSLILVKCYDGMASVIPLNNENKQQLNALTVRTEDLNVTDITYLHGYETPTLAVMCKEPNNKLQLKVYDTDRHTKEFTQVLWKREICDLQAFIIPVPEPCCGVIVVGTQAIYYFNNNSDPIQIAPSLLASGEMIAYCPVDTDGRRYFLSSISGSLYMLLLDYTETMNNTCKVTNLNLELLGEVSIADNITYIDNGVVFIGSKIGDSQLIKLIEEPNEKKSFVDVLETYTNLGPIMDMLVVDIEKQGQGQLVTCSGAYRNGSLRIIRSGIGIHESANVELAGVKAMWPLRINSNEFDSHLILSFYDYTRVFSFIGEEFEEIELDGIDATNQTLQCSNVNHGKIVQITPIAIRLIDAKTCKLVNEWRIGEGEYISVGSNNYHQCLCASRNQLLYFLINENGLELVNQVKLEYEIACLDISPLKENEMADICAVGLWTDISARLFKLPTLKQLCVESLGGDIIPRSIIIETLEQIPYLFTSLGDGSVISYIISKNSENDEYVLNDKRKVVLGTQPTILKKFKATKNAETSSVFACSDRPSVISTNNQKLLYSSVNLKQVEYMCQLNAAYYQDSLAIISSGVLRIGTMDNIQKLHIRTVDLGETARRIAYQPETQTFGVITHRFDTFNYNGELKPMRPSASTLCQNQITCTTELSKPQEVATMTAAAAAAAAKSASDSASNNRYSEFSQYEQFMIHSFLLLDQNTFEVLYSVQFQMHEYATAILSINFEGDSNTYYVIGCCYVMYDEPEPKLGRIIVFKYSENKLIQVCEKEIKGSPFTMQAYNGKLLVSVNNTIKLYEFKYEELNQLAVFSDNVFITQLKVKNDFILVGDLMRSCSVFVYKTDTNLFELVSKDNNPIWLNSIEMIDDENFLCNDGFHNVNLLKKDSGQSNEEERKCLQNVGCAHLGEQVNVFRHGSLGMQQSNELYATHFQTMIIAGCVSGSIIIFLQLSNNMYKILNELQQRLAKHTISAGKINYDKWRLYENDRRSEPQKFFIDGDLIESFLDLNLNDASNVIKDFKVDGVTINEEFNVNYFLKLVEELSRIH